jgi:hypothetical protein
MENKHNNTNPWTYQFDLETTKSICSAHNKEVADVENGNSFDILNHIDNINQFVSKHSGGTLPEEEHNKFIRGQKEPLIAEWSHTSWNPKPMDAPWTLHDVGDLVGPIDSVGGAHQKHKVNYGSGNDGDMLNNMGRSRRASMPTTSQPQAPASSTPSTRTSNLPQQTSTSTSMSTMSKITIDGEEIEYDAGNTTTANVVILFPKDKGVKLSE